jgi:hypothetical protein
MAGCLVMLAVIIASCVALGKSAIVSAESTDTEQNEELSQAPQGEQEDPQTQESTISKVYSEGLAFRSNGDGTCAVAGLGSCTASCILIPPTSPAGDTVTEVLPYAFFDTIVAAIELPPTVTTLTAASFAGCKRLSFVRVDGENPTFVEHDGVLYAAGGSTLVYCPSGRSAGELRLHASLRRIAAGAFAECGNLTTVYFSGSVADWQSLIVGDCNDALYAAALRFQAQ